MHLVFVYGTLKRGFANHDPVLQGQRFCGDYITCQAFPLIIGGPWFVPSLLPEPGEGHRVSGELFDVDEPCLCTLDLLESIGEPDGYERQMIEIRSLRDGSTARAWVYFRDRTGAGLIHGEPLQSYPNDPRYIIGEERAGRDEGEGSRRGDR